MSEWIPPTVTDEETPSPTANRPDGRSVKATCDACGHTVYTWIPTAEPSAVRLLGDHVQQHAPGRALDITVGWELVASCSVCPDGGDIVVCDSETIECRTCGTTWDSDGKCGERTETNDE